VQLYGSKPPRNAADFLELAENYTFLDRKLIHVINLIVKIPLLFVKGGQGRFPVHILKSP
jgi:hypothetical protein